MVTHKNYNTKIIFFYENRPQEFIFLNIALVLIVFVRVYVCLYVSLSIDDSAMFGLNFNKIYLLT